MAAATGVDPKSGFKIKRLKIILRVKQASLMALKGREGGPCLILRERYPYDLFTVSEVHGRRSRCSA